MKPMVRRNLTRACKSTWRTFDALAALRPVDRRACGPWGRVLIAVALVVVRRLAVHLEGVVRAGEVAEMVAEVPEATP